LAGLAVWQFIPALHVLPHVIYFEWIICIGSFLLVPVFDSQPIKTPALEREDVETVVDDEEISKEHVLS